MIHNELLSRYSTEVQTKVANMLKVYDKCHVERHGQNYIVTTSWTLKSAYGDEEILDEFSKDDIYTKEEQMLNYVESFHEYPITYKGERDYRMLHAIHQRANRWDAKFKFDERGNIIEA